MTLRNIDAKVKQYMQQLEEQKREAEKHPPTPPSSPPAPPLDKGIQNKYTSPPSSPPQVRAVKPEVKLHVQEGGSIVQVDDDAAGAERELASSGNNTEALYWDKCWEKCTNESAKLVLRIGALESNNTKLWQAIENVTLTLQLEQQKTQNLTELLKLEHYATTALQRNFNSLKAFVEQQVMAKLSNTTIPDVEVVASTTEPVNHGPTWQEEVGAGALSVYQFLGKVAGRVAGFIIRKADIVQEEVTQGEERSHGAAYISGQVMGGGSVALGAGLIIGVLRRSYHKWLEWKAKPLDLTGYTSSRYVEPEEEEMQDFDPNSVKRNKGGSSSDDHKSPPPPKSGMIMSVFVGCMTSFARTPVNPGEELNRVVTNLVRQGADAPIDPVLAQQYTTAPATTIQGEEFQEIPLDEPAAPQQNFALRALNVVPTLVLRAWNTLPTLPGRHPTVQEEGGRTAVILTTPQHERDGLAFPMRFESPITQEDGDMWSEVPENDGTTTVVEDTPSPQGFFVRPLNFFVALFRRGQTNSEPPTTVEQVLEDIGNFVRTLDDTTATPPPGTFTLGDVPDGAGDQGFIDYSAADQRSEESTVQGGQFNMQTENVEGFEEALHPTPGIEEPTVGNGGPLGRTITVPTLTLATQADEPFSGNIDSTSPSPESSPPHSTATSPERRPTLTPNGRAETDHTDFVQPEVRPRSLHDSFDTDTQPTRQLTDTELDGLIKELTEPQTPANGADTLSSIGSSVMVVSPDTGGVGSACSFPSSPEASQDSQDPPLNGDNGWTY